MKPPRNTLPRLKPPIRINWLRAKGRFFSPGIRKLKKDQIKVNATDPDSRVLKSSKGHFIQGYNCQASVDGDTQIILANDVVDFANDRMQLSPMIDRTLATPGRAGIDLSQTQAIVADAGYWSHLGLDRSLESLAAVLCQSPPDLLVAVPPSYQKLSAPISDATPPAPDENIYVQHEHKQRCPAGQKIFHKRARSIEAVFGQIKSIRRIDHFLQRGMGQVKMEWSLACTTHNLLKLWRRVKGQEAGKTPRDRPLAPFRSLLRILILIYTRPNRLPASF